MRDEELREIVKNIRSGYAVCFHENKMVDKNLESACQFIERYLEAGKGWTEKLIIEMVCGNALNVERAKGYNDAVDDCLLAHLRHLEEMKERGSVERIEEIVFKHLIGNVPKEMESLSMPIATAVHNLIFEEIKKEGY